MDEEGGRDGETQARSGSAHGSDDTPRPESSSITIVQKHNQNHNHDGSDSEDSYFSLQPTQSHTSASVSSLQAVTSPTITHAPYDADQDSAHPLDLATRLSNHLDIADRPPVQRDLSHISTASIESTDSTTTVTGYDAGYDSSYDASYAFASQHTPRRPTYPNQAFSALQQQRYPPPHLPPNLRTKTFHHPQPQTFRQAIASLHQSGSRTADASPAPAPGLFNPTNTPVAQSQTHLGPDEQGFYSSPFLHFTHRQAPKETHIADVDIDPISGRKLINNYEIIDELGRGTHGKVKLGRNLDTHEYVAIKIVERYSKKRRLGKLGNAEDKVKKEVAILKKARHPNIVALLEVIDDPARKKVYIVLERVELGEVVWRATAPKEVALIELRRYDREALGVHEDQEAQAEDRAILEEAKARRGRQQRRQFRKLRRQRGGRSGPEAWSFEFGGDSDSSDSDMERASRLSTTTTENSRETLSRAPTPGPQVDSDSTELVTPVKTTAPPLDISTHPLDPSLLEGTMYGSYDGDDVLLRAPSLASSVQSFGPPDLRAYSANKQYSVIAPEILDSDIHPDLLYVPCMPLQAARIAFRDTVLGLQYLHWQGIIHRDIKPPNLLQTYEHRIKISDFGVSYLGRPIIDDQAENLSESDAQDFDEAKELAKTVGTAAFYAPELCYTDIPLDGEHTPSVGTAIDVWALGITLFCMLFGRTPFVDSEYVVMRRIADEEIYIPRKRLRPVDPRPKSRPSSHGRHFPPTASGRRSEYELAYEELDDALLDLLSRLLIKDPERRITLEEVRHHPWVLQDIPNKELWLDETDPFRQAQGKRIQVSKEELQDAVVPVRLVERIRSGLKKTVGGLMSGLGRAGSTRQRAPSISGPNTPSAGSSSSTISQDARRNSLRGDESIFFALKASRESDHPLAQSVTVSPETTPAGTSASTPTGAPGYHDGAILAGDLSRPNAPERAKSIMSTTTSIRTIRPHDIISPPTGSPPASPHLMNANETSTVANLGGLLSGAGRRILRTVRDRSIASRSTDSLDKSGQATPDPMDPHGGPSVAVTNTQASGHMDPPEALKGLTPASSAVASPTNSRSHSVTARGQRDRARDGAGLQKVTSKSPRRIANDSTERGFRRAEEEFMRRRILEDEAAFASSDRSARPMSPSTCPPSPDDEVNFRKRVKAFRSDVIFGEPSMDTSPASRTSSILPLMTPSSSEDRFRGGTPMTLSNPSIPSVTTVDSEAQAEEIKLMINHGEPLTSSDTMGLRPYSALEEVDCAGETAVDSDEDDDEYEDSSDDDGGLQMVRRRSIPQSVRQSSGSNCSHLNSHRLRRETGSSAFSKKSSRSGSNNTMKKVRTNESSIEEGLISE